MNKPLFLILLTLLAAAPAFADAEKKPIQVQGDSVEYFHERQTVVGTGNVVIDYEGTRLAADKVTVHMTTKEATAEGNVILTQKGSVFKGDRGVYNFGTRTGDVERLRAEVEPHYYARAKRIEKISDEHYRCRDGWITTCKGDHPFYRIQATHIDIYPEQKVVIRNAVLYVRQVPVMYVPYYVQYFFDFERLPVQLIPGKNSEWGAFLLSKWRYNLIEQPAVKSRGNVLVDYRTERGLAYGAENFYRTDALGRGAARFYFISDEKPPEEASQERHRAQWRHQMRLAPDTTLSAEINDLSDATVIKDFFFREEYERDVLPDNYLSIITAKPEYTLSVLQRSRLDEFFTVVERNPEVRFDTYNRPFLDTPFYARHEFQGTNLNKEFADSGVEFDASRFDSNHTLSYAGRVGDISVVPHAGTRHTYYSRDSGGERDSVRTVYDAGVDFSTRFFNVYDVSVHRWGLDWNRLRHIFAPTVSYNWRPSPTVDRGSLQQFDALDAIDKQHFIRFNFENRVQTKEGKDLATRQIARVIPFFDLDYDTHRLDNIGYDAEFQPWPWLGIESDMIYDSVDQRVETANADLWFSRGAVSFAIGQRYLRDESMQTTTELRWRVNDEWEVRLYDRYEFETSENKEYELTVSKAFDCVIVDFTYNHRDGDTFFVALRLAAFPDVPFGLSQTYNRPKTPAVTGIGSRRYT